MEYAIAVIDIGMTNKKIAVYDDSLRQLDARYKNFKPVMVKDLECHDLAGMEAWFIAELKDLAKRFPIKALAVSVHGATFVCMGKDGTPIVPCVFYTHEPGQEFYNRFYEKFGKAEELQARTGTPAFRAMINPAKGLFFAKEEFPDEFKQVTCIVPYNQYWGFRFTGNAGVESTYMGNHTYLWDQIDNTLSSVAHDLGIAELIPNALKKPWDVLGTISADFAEKTGLSQETIVTMGIHDSNSAMLPHFAKKGEKGFILNSTGTWCVIMNPVEKYGFAKDELGKVVFFNIGAFGTPIKTAIFLGGQEFEIWSQLFMKLYNRNDIPKWNEDLYRSIMKEKRISLMPELTQGSGQFPSSKARIILDGKNYYFDDLESFSDSTVVSSIKYEECFAALRLSLVMQTLTALERAGIENGYELYTEGGFRKDESYSVLLASALPNNKAYLTDISEAAALGAAMTGKMALTGKSIKDLAGDFEISYREQEKKSFPELNNYRKAWLDEVSKLG
jgi:sugar (pentulose or hexulose) kinase